MSFGNDVILLMSIVSAEGSTYRSHSGLFLTIRLRLPPAIGTGVELASDSRSASCAALMLAFMSNGILALRDGVHGDDELSPSME